MADEIDVSDINQLEQMRQLEQLKKQLLNKILTKEALERLSRVRVVNPNLAGQAELYLLQIYQQGKISERITDAQIKEVLKVLTTKKDFSIKRR